MRLRTKLTVFLLLATIFPVIVVIILFHTRTSSILINKNMDFLTSTAAKNTESVDEYFSGIESIIFNYRTNTRMIEFLKTVNNENYRDNKYQILTSEISEKLETFLQLYTSVKSICIFPTADGIPILRGEYERNLVSSYRTNRILVDSLETPEKVSWVLEWSDKTNTAILNITTGISDRYTEDVVGCINLKIDMYDYYSKSATLLKSDVPFIVTDENRNIIYQHDESLSEEDFKKAFLAQSGMNEGESYECVIGDKHYMVVETVSKVTNWRFFYYTNKSEIMDEVKKVSMFTLGLTAIFAVLSIFGAIYLYFKIYSPIHILTNSMKKFEDGNLDLEVPVTNKDEISMLAKTFNRLIGQIKELIQKTEEIQKKKSEMEIKALQAQITPHFLYNTLNSIKSLARLKRSDDIISMTESLIDLLRLSASRPQLITVTEEIDYVKAYAKLMSYRSGRKYRIEIQMDSIVMNAAIPKFTLQPIVENSIIHGFSNDIELEAVIEITGQKENNMIVITVSDNGSGITEQQKINLNRELSNCFEQSLRQFNGIGINNIQQRLTLEFGENAVIHIEQNRPYGTKVIVSFPQKTVADMTEM